jgi:hypothetical protein
MQQIMITNLPRVLAEFREKQFSLLQRGSRDNFKAQEFQTFPPVMEWHSISSKSVICG